MRVGVRVRVGVGVRVRVGARVKVGESVRIPAPVHNLNAALQQYRVRPARRALEF